MLPSSMENASAAATPLHSDALSCSDCMSRDPAAAALVAVDFCSRSTEAAEEGMRARVAHATRLASPRFIPATLRRPIGWRARAAGIRWGPGVGERSEACVVDWGMSTVSRMVVVFGGGMYIRRLRAAHGITNNRHPQLRFGFCHCLLCFQLYTSVVSVPKYASWTNII